MPAPQADQLAMLLGPDGKRFILRLKPGAEFQTHLGVLSHDRMLASRWGSQLETHLGKRLLLLQPTLRDLVLHTKRKTQIVFPKDLGYILLRLSIAPGTTVLEAGTGSGALTSALAWMVGEQGQVISYDRRPEMQALALENLQLLGLESRVVFHPADIGEGFREQEIEALFLDLSDPHEYVSQARSALADGGRFGAILPTANQVSDLLTALGKHDFSHIEVCETMLRFYKPVPQRLRPVDRMVAHTGYLVFARAVLPSTEP